MIRLLINREQEDKTIPKIPLTYIRPSFQIILIWESKKNATDSITDNSSGNLTVPTGFQFKTDDT